MKAFHCVQNRIVRDGKVGNIIHEKYISLILEWRYHFVNSCEGLQKQFGNCFIF